jgi:hypothetical protein
MVTPLIVEQQAEGLQVGQVRAARVFERGQRVARAAAAVRFPEFVRGQVAFAQVDQGRRQTEGRREQALFGIDGRGVHRDQQSRVGLGRAHEQAFELFGHGAPLAHFGERHAKVADRVL